MILCDGVPELAKIIDFGVVERAVSPHPRPQDLFVAGTPGYLAPERRRGGPPTVHSDLYAVGALLFELVTGLRPSGTPKERTRSWADGLDCEAAAWASLPKALADELAALLAPLPDRRPEDALTAQAGLARAAAQLPPDLATAGTFLVANSRHAIELPRTRPERHFVRAPAATEPVVASWHEPADTVRSATLPSGSVNGLEPSADAFAGWVAIGSDCAGEVARAAPLGERQHTAHQVSERVWLFALLAAEPRAAAAADAVLVAAELRALFGSALDAEGFAAPCACKPAQFIEDMAAKGRHPPAAAEFGSLCDALRQWLDARARVAPSAAQKSGLGSTPAGSARPA